MKRIGITINLKQGLFLNGVNQNAIYLANLLKEAGYNAYLIHNLDEDIEDINGINVITFKKAFLIPFALVFQLGLSMHLQLWNNFKANNKNVKLVAYECGNKFIMDMEASLFKPEEDTIISDRAKPHQIWSIPQMEKTSIDYYKFINKQDKATVVPFIWEPLAIEDICKDKDYSIYTPRNLNRIAVLEPNISVMKNFMIPLVIVDRLYSKDKSIEDVVFFGCDRIRTNKTFTTLINSSKLSKDKKIFANTRTNTLDVINHMSDIVLSWQWENNLNYLWLELAWLGWPVVHNGNLCQDVGYYYNSFNVDEATSMLQYARRVHNEDVTYIERNRNIIKRYTHKNEKLKEQYKVLVENVLNNKFEKYSYDWKTNAIL